MSGCTLVLHEDCGRHDPGWGHPEHQGRLPAILRAIEAATPELLDSIRQHRATPAPLEAIRYVHTPGHVERVRALAASAATEGRPVHADSDTLVSEASWDAACAAAGCAIDAVRTVMAQESRTAFALCRPPGHHATAERIMGFCLFNNVAIAARELHAAHGIERVLIIDWDVHHGNGTQDIFWEDGGVYYLSLHQSPWYPGTGFETERGAGAGLDRTRNVPLRAGTTAVAYRRVFVEVVDEAFRSFDPEFVLVSAGFDAMAGDPLGGLLLEPADLHAMTRFVMQGAEATANGRVVAVLEGGYAPARVGEGVVAVLAALSAHEV
ncbi:MAG: histone deacetylase [Gemmatimonadetes bacterium]|nr:histone deacetylase [Gemmatimonadota bacterium]